MTNLEERLKELANESVRHPDLRMAYMMGFKAALEMPELKALVEEFEQIEELRKSTLYPSIVHRISDNMTKAITQWRSFIGEGGNERSE